MRRQTDIDELVQTRTEHVARALLHAVREVGRARRSGAVAGERPLHTRSDRLELSAVEDMRRMLSEGEGVATAAATAVEVALRVAEETRLDVFGSLSVVTRALIRESASAGHVPDDAIAGVLQGARRALARRPGRIEEAMVLAKASVLGATMGNDTWNPL